mgnify:FL=1
MKLRHGMTVMTARYAVVLRGRNQCFPDQWWGHPIIEGKIMKRHTIVLKADTLNMTLYVTDTPVTWRKRTGSGPGKTEGVVRRLKDLYFAKKILEVTTTDCVYSNMVITSMSIKKSVEVGYAREIPISFKKIEVTETATAEIPASYGKSGKTGKAAGKASTTAASTAGSSSSSGSSSGSSSSSRSSVLYNTASGFGLLG